MKHPFITLALIAIAIALAACGTPQKAVQRETQSRSVEVRYEKVFVRDTAYIEIPAQTAERTAADSASHLENDYAISDARINDDGTLFHDLKTKPQKKPVPTEKQIERKDSLVYVNKEVEVPVTVEKELTPWQRFRLRWFVPLAAAALALAALAFRKPIRGMMRRLV